MAVATSMRLTLRMTSRIGTSPAAMRGGITIAEIGGTRLSTRARSPSGSWMAANESRKDAMSTRLSGVVVFCSSS